ncbi:transposase, partial [Thermodesulfobacteriota bacterium]
MKRSRISEEKIVRILNEADAGVSIQDLCRKYGMSDSTFYNWKKKFGGMAISDVKRLKAL